MMRLPLQTRIIVAVLLLGCLSAGITLWWLCVKSDRIAFLSAKSGAEWIVYPKPAEGARQRALLMMAVFRRSFNVSDLSAKTILTFRAFKSAGININDQVVPTNATDAESNWKVVRSI